MAAAFDIEPVEAACGGDMMRAVLHIHRPPLRAVAERSSPAPFPGARIFAAGRTRAILRRSRPRWCWLPPPGALARVSQSCRSFMLSAPASTTLLADPACRRRAGGAPGRSRHDRGNGRICRSFRCCASIARTCLSGAAAGRALWREHAQPNARRARGSAVLGLGVLGSEAALAAQGAGLRRRGLEPQRTALQGHPCYSGWGRARRASPRAARSWSAFCRSRPTPRNILDARLFAPDAARREPSSIAARGAHLVRGGSLPPRSKTGRSRPPSSTSSARSRCRPAHPFWPHPPSSSDPHAAAASNPRTAAPIVAALARFADERAHRHRSCARG